MFKYKLNAKQLTEYKELKYKWKNLYFIVVRNCEMFHSLPNEIILIIADKCILRNSEIGVRALYNVNGISVNNGKMFMSSDTNLKFHYKSS